MPRFISRKYALAIGIVRLTVIEKGISDNLREQVVGIVLPENKASVTVLLKVGFRWKENLELFGFNVEKYTL